MTDEEDPGPAETKNPKVDAFLQRASKWQAEMTALREIALSCKLTEELKWGKPCYTSQGGNVVLIVPFKDYCSLLFPAGALITDDKHLLILPTENTQAARQARFTSLDQVKKHKAAMKAFIRQAAQISESGEKVAFKKVSEFAVPEELQARLDANLALKKAFESLTPGRQRGYLLHIGGAKQSRTREARVEKCTPQILAGKGLDD